MIKSIIHALKSITQGKGLPWVFLAGITLPFLTSCIQRNNPYDPINFRPIISVSQQKEIQDSILLRLNQLFSQSLTLMPTVETAHKNNTSDTLSIKVTLTQTNPTIVNQNTSKKSENNFFETSNKTATSADSIRDKSYLNSLFLVSTITDTSKIQNVKSSIALNRNIAKQLIDSINTIYTIHKTDTIITTSVSNYWFSRFDSLISQCDIVYLSVLKTNKLVHDTNEFSIAPYNADVILYNEKVSSYNDSIYVVRHYFGITPLTSKDSISARLKSFNPGEVILLGSGIFSPPELKNNGKVSTTEPTIIIGQANMTTIISKSDVVLSGAQNVTFKNISFRNNIVDGVRCINNSQSIVFENCDFDSNGANGIKITDADVKLVNCRVRHNKGQLVNGQIKDGNGIYVTTDGISPTNRLELHNVLIAQNANHGVFALSCTIQLDSVTIDSNANCGIYLLPSPKLLTLKNTIITGNLQYGISFSSTGANDTILKFGNKPIFYGNASGAFFNIIVPTQDYSSFPIEYVNKSNYDYRILSPAGLAGTIGYQTLTLP